MEYFRNTKTLIADIVVDIVGNLFLAIGVYNFAVASNFPVSGFAGITVILNHFTNISIGTWVIILNIPIVLFSYRILGREFYIKSVKTMIVETIMLDYVAPLFPVFEGDLMLSAICMGIFVGTGLGIIYLRGSSIAGADFVIMAIRKLNPHLSIGRLISLFDWSVIIVGGILMNSGLEKIIYALIGDYILTLLIDKIMYGADSGKMTLIVTDYADEIAKGIYRVIQRGATLIKAEGSYTKKDKNIVMCACNNRQMHLVHKVVKEIDKDAFMITVESNEVRGNGFKAH